MVQLSRCQCSAGRASRTAHDPAYVHFPSLIVSRTCPSHRTHLHLPYLQDLRKWRFTAPVIGMTNSEAQLSAAAYMYMYPRQPCRRRQAPSVM